MRGLSASSQVWAPCRTVLGKELLTKAGDLAQSALGTLCLPLPVEV